MVPAWSLPGSVSFASACRRAISTAWSPLADLDPRRHRVLQYTGGVADRWRRKGAMLTHGNIVANLQHRHRLADAGPRSEPAETIVTALPLYPHLRAHGELPDQNWRLPIC